MDMASPIRRVAALIALLFIGAYVAAGTEPDVVRWTLDQNPPSLDVAELQLLGHERRCAGGQSAEGRISYELVETSEEVKVVVKIVPRSGLQTCQGVPPTPIVVPLDQPLGERRLVDGATGYVVRPKDR